MRYETIRSLLKRELLDIIRDKKTVAMMVVLPILLYPLLIVGMAVLFSSINQSQAEKEYRVAVTADADVEAELIKLSKSERDDIGYDLIFQLGSKIGDDSALKEALENKTILAYARQESEGNYKICYLSASNDSVIAKNALQKVFSLYEDDLRKQRLTEAGLDVKTILEPIEVTGKDMSSAEESMGNQIGSLLPFFIITSVLLGAMYPAIDVTAGEKERGTLETLLTLPVTNLELILSKFLAVSLISCVSAFLNIFSMGGAMVFLVSSSLMASSDLNIKMDYAVFLPGIGFTLLVMVFFSLLVTAVCMSTCIFARSFKEANNYSTPVMLIFMFGSYASLLPDLELTQKTAAIPIVNVALMIKSLFGFTSDYGLFAIVLFTNAAYSFLAVLLMSRLYNSEAVLFSEGFSSIRLFTRRSDMKENQMPGGGDVILVLAITLLAMIYLGTFAVAKFGFWGVAIQQLMILLVPLGYAWYIKADRKKLFSFKRPKLLHLLGGLLMFAGAFVLAMIVGSLLAPYFPQSAENLQDLSGFLDSSGSKVITAVVIALMPAMGEELLFRGFLMGTLKQKAKPVVVIATVEVLFAAYHMSILRFFTVGIIGLSFTIAAYKSESIFVSMLMHFCNNLTACLVQWYPDSVLKLLNADPNVASSPLTGVALLAGALVFVTVGYLLLCRNHSK